MSLTSHLIYFLLWASFGAGHTILAGPRAKAAFSPTLGCSYRFTYNLAALVHIGLVIYGGQFLLYDGSGSFSVPASVETAMSGAMVLGVITFIIALSQYDLGRFAGVTQLFWRQSDDIEEPLHLGGLHRFVRHPLYTGVYLYLWGSVRNEFDLATAIWASAYLIIGSHFEERKLIATYGKAYSDYKKSVPAIIPWRGRAI